MFFQNSADGHRVGFVGLINGEIWRTTDWGNSWEKTITPAPYNFTTVSDFTFKDNLVGWASRRRVTGDCLKTTDGGITWFNPSIPRLRYDLDATAIYYNSTTKLLFLSTWYDSSMVSEDDGVTWRKISIGGGLCGISFSSPMRGLYCHPNGQPNFFWRATSDGGFTWYDVGISVEIWQPLAIEGTPFVVGVEDGNGRIYRSEDYGSNWKIVADLPFYTTGSMYSGSCNRLYIQGATDAGSTTRGIFCSADLGQTWNTIGGPFNATDTRFTVFGDTIIASDNEEGLWMFVHRPTLYIPRSPITISTKACSDFDTVLYLRNDFCENIDSITVSTIDSKNITVLLPSGNTAKPTVYFPIDLHTTIAGSGSYTEKFTLHYYHLGQKYDTTITVDIRVTKSDSKAASLSTSYLLFNEIPTCINSDSSFLIRNLGCDSLIIDSIWISGSKTFSISTSNVQRSILSANEEKEYVVRFSPQGIGLQAGYTHIRYTYDGITSDTVIQLAGVGIQNLESVKILDALLQFDTVSSCNTKQLSTHITNSGCDSVYIDIADHPTDGFRLISPSQGVWIKNGDTLTVIIEFSSTILGGHTSHVMLNGKLSSTSSVNLVADLKGIIGEPYHKVLFSFTDYPFDTLSCNSTDSATLSLSSGNICDSLQLLDIQFADPVNFVATSNLPIGISISPNDTATIIIGAIPKTVADHTSTLLVRYKIGSLVKDTTLVLEIKMKKGGAIIGESISSLDFGSLPICKESDSTISLRNTGCDTLRVLGVGVQGIGFSSNVTTPIIIAPGDSITIPVTTKVDISQGNISTGIITFISDADNKIEPIALSRGYTYPKSYSFHIAMLDGTATSGEIVRLAIVGEQGLGSAGSGVNRLDFDLALNEDLLEYIRPEGSNTVSKNGSRITISNQNELTCNNDTLAILVYHVFLTKDSATDITVSNISINNGDTSSCAPKIAAATQAGFTYRYECGDRHIQSFLRTGQASLEITSIHPNPAKDELTVEFVQNEKTNVSFEVYDMLGTLILKKEEIYDRGQKKKTIELRDMPSGSYVISLRSAVGVTSRLFTKEK